MSGIEPNTLANLYDWLDTIPFSRPKKNLARDFSDALLAGELIKYFFPAMVDLHNYPSTNSLEQKKINWSTLNYKVLKKLDFPLSDGTILELASSKREATEYFLNALRGQIDSHLKKKAECTKKTRRHSENTLNDEVLMDSSIQVQGYSRKSFDCSPPKSLKDLDLDEIKSTSNSKTKKWWTLRDPNSDTVPRAAYEQKVQELLERDETIQILKARIKRLEYMLQFKEITVGRLQHLLDELKPPTQDSGDSEQNQETRTKTEKAHTIS